VEVSYLPDAESHPLWPAMREMLKPAAEFGGLPIEDGDHCVWIAFDGLTVFGVVTTILWDDGEASILLGAGTRLHDWMPQMEAVVSAWARDCGATKLTMKGRKGWGRFARPFGWVALDTDNEGRVLFEKDLTDGRQAEVN